MQKFFHPSGSMIYKAVTTSIKEGLRKKKIGSVLVGFYKTEPALAAYHGRDFWLHLHVSVLWSVTPCSTSSLVYVS